MAHGRYATGSILSVYDGDTCQPTLCWGAPRAFRLGWMESILPSCALEICRRSSTRSVQRHPRDMVLGRVVWMDVRTKSDKYGRLLAEIWVPKPAPDWRGATLADGSPPGTNWTSVNSRMLQMSGTSIYSGGAKTSFASRIASEAGHSSGARDRKPAHSPDHNSDQGPHGTLIIWVFYKVFRGF